MNKWERLQWFYEELSRADIYEQPDEPGRVEISKAIISMAPLDGCETVLDVGCGQGYAQELFKGKTYLGITRSLPEVKVARERGRNVVLMDYNFIELPQEYDLIFSSHALEHSPFPLLTLMEWHRVGRRLLLVVPNPSHYGYIGKNHYSVSETQQVRWWLRRAGWRVIWNLDTKTDIAYLSVREPRIGSEGWANMSRNVYEADRDNKIYEGEDEDSNGG